MFGWSNVQARWNSLFKSLGVFRRRIIFVTVVVFSAWILTVAVLVWRGQFGASFGEAVLAAWVGELLFFTIVGAVISLIVIRDPVDEGFDERIRILYGRGQLPAFVLNYNKAQISKLAAFSRNARRTVYIEKFDRQLSAYWTRIRTEYDIENGFPDVPYRDTLIMRIQPDTFKDSEVADVGRVLSLRIGETEHIHEPVVIAREGGFNTELNIEVPEKGEITVVMEYETLMRTGETQSLRPLRAVEKFSMSIIGRCEPAPRIEIVGDEKGRAISLLYNQAVPLRLASGVVPSELIFGFKLLAPD
jgi:hypothetical protein